MLGLRSVSIGFYTLVRVVRVTNFISRHGRQATRSQGGWQTTFIDSSTMGCGPWTVTTVKNRKEFFASCGSTRANIDDLLWGVKTSLSWTDAAHVRYVPLSQTIRNWLASRSPTARTTTVTAGGRYRLLTITFSKGWGSSSFQLRCSIQKHRPIIWVGITSNCNYDLRSFGCNNSRFWRTTGSVTTT